MYRGTTPNLIFKLNTELDMASLSEVWLTIKGANYSHTWKTSELSIDAEHKTVGINLTQAETLRYDAGEADAQIRLLTDMGTAMASSIVKLNINRILQGGVIDNE